MEPSRGSPAAGAATARSRVRPVRCDGDVYWKLLGKGLSSLVREGEARPQSEPLAWVGSSPPPCLTHRPACPPRLRLSPTRRSLGHPCSHTRAVGAGSRGPLGAASLEGLISGGNVYAARSSESAGTHPCHRPRPTTRQSWDQVGKLVGDASGTTTPTSFWPFMVHLCHHPVCDIVFVFYFFGPVGVVPTTK
ncbi:unnamed protein product [Nyctereutes procyonoides]|uniref:(raccoon dog) hypothetical protein n=1 Tax=Nyctereutes procyonoides TaxID=34880 RepID=A0A811ZIQ2_NYCPR|nr:unnamed protein product [Nyctereutes procyonoides]